MIKRCDKLPAGSSGTSDRKLCLWEVHWLIHSYTECLEKKGRRKKNGEKKGKWGRVTIIWSEVAMETDPSSQPLESESHEWIEGHREHTCIHVIGTCTCVHVCYCTCCILRKFTFHSQSEDIFWGVRTFWLILKLQGTLSWLRLGFKIEVRMDGWIDR